MVKKNKGKGEFVDEEKTLKQIDNPEFMAMRRMQRQFPKPSTQEAELDLLVAHGLIQEKFLSNYLLPGEHVITSPSPDQSILFIPFVRAGLCFPLSDFLLEFLGSYQIQLHHLTPNGVLLLSAFAHLCKTFIGIPPPLLLFCYFFHMRLSDSKNPPFFGCCLLQSRQGRKETFPSLTLSDSVRDWAEKWFYVPKPVPSFSSDLSLTPTSLPIWKDKLSLVELMALKPLLTRISLLKQASLTGNGIVASFLRRQVQPLMQRVHFGFEYTGSPDPSRLILDAELSEEIVLERLGRILSGVSVMPARVDEYDAAHPPPEVCVCLPEFFCIGSF